MNKELLKLYPVNFDLITLNTACEYLALAERTADEVEEQIRNILDSGFLEKTHFLTQKKLLYVNGYTRQAAQVTYDINPRATFYAQLTPYTVERKNLIRSLLRNAITIDTDYDGNFIATLGNLSVMHRSSTTIAELQLLNEVLQEDIL